MGGENCRYYNDTINYSADVTMKFNNDKPVKVTGRGGDMKIEGTLGVVKGTYKYFNTEMTMDAQKESKIIFDGDRRPVLDIYATTVLRKFEFNSKLGYSQGACFPVWGWRRIPRTLACTYGLWAG